MHVTKSSLRGVAQALAHGAIGADWHGVPPSVVAVRPGEPDFWAMPGANLGSGGNRL